MTPLDFFRLIFLALFCGALVFVIVTSGQLRRQRSIAPEVEEGKAPGQLGVQPLRPAAKEPWAATPLSHRVSHEALRHLESVSDFAHRLARQNLAPEAQACVRVILDTSDDLTALLRGAVDLHQAELGVLSFDNHPCQLRDLMDAVDARWKRRAAAGGLTLLTAYDGDPELVADLDEGRLMQVFDALILHALNETKRGAVEATLKVRPSNNGLIIAGRVRDAGDEMSPERLARIFEPAGAGDDQTHSLSVGLGMTLAKRIVIGTGGVIRAERNPGAGVTVVFEFIAPLGNSVAAAAADADADAAEVGETIDRPHILIVDDNVTNRMVAEALCEMFECSSEQAVDGVEALEAVQARQFDLILMDIKMPRMDGVAATKAIRALSGPVGQTPIVALTANANPDDVRGYLEVGMNDVIEKPINAERMLAVLRAILSTGDESSAVA